MSGRKERGIVPIDMIMNDEDLSREAKIDRAIAARKAQAVLIRPKIDTLVDYARKLKEEIHLHEMKFGPFNIVQQYEDGYDMALDKSFRNWKNHYEVYFRVGVMNTHFVMEYKDDEILRYIPGPWITELDLYLDKAARAYDKKMDKKQAKQRKAIDERKEYALKEKMNNFGISE